VAVHLCTEVVDFRVTQGKMIDKLFLQTHITALKAIGPDWLLEGCGALFDFVQHVIKLAMFFRIWWFS
jgi:hypothetical protein